MLAMQYSRAHSQAGHWCGSAPCMSLFGTRNASPWGASSSDPAWFFCLTSYRIESLVTDYIRISKGPFQASPLDNLQAATLLKLPVG